MNYFENEADVPTLDLIHGGAINLVNEIKELLEALNLSDTKPIIETLAKAIAQQNYKLLPEIRSQLKLVAEKHKVRAQREILIKIGQFIHYAFGILMLSLAENQL